MFKMLRLKKSRSPSSKSIDYDLLIANTMLHTQHHLFQFISAVMVGKQIQIATSNYIVQTFTFVLLNKTT